MATDSDANSYVKDGKLYITPTLTEDVIGRDKVLNGYTYNLTSCTNLISGKSRLDLACPSASPHLFHRWQRWQDPEPQRLRCCLQ